MNIEEISRAKVHLNSSSLLNKYIKISFGKAGSNVQ